METELLMRLKHLTGVSYLSDLHSELMGKALYNALMTIQPEEYELKEWEEAIEYILKDEHIHCRDVMNARQFLCERIQTGAK